MHSRRWASSMCMVDSYDGPGEGSFMDQRIISARKEHSCYECRRKISPGETYQRTTAMWHRGEGIDTYKVCRHCVQAEKWLARECGGWLYGGVLEDLEEHWREEETTRSWRLGR